MVEGEDKGFGRNKEKLNLVFVFVRGLFDGMDGGG